MIIFYINPKKPHHARLIRELFRSYNGEKVLHPSNRFNDIMIANQKAKTIVFAGMIRGEGLIYKWCVENKKEFLFLDHAYLLRGYNINNEYNEWMRITRSNFTWNLNLTESSDRWNRYFSQQYIIKPWEQKKLGNILVLPPSTASKYLFPESENWTNQTIKEVLRHIDAPVVIREKPDQPQIDYSNNSVFGRIKHNHDKTIEEEIAEARCIISFNSGVPIQGIINGIPCIVSNKSAAFPMSTKIHEIAYPPEPDRLAWLYQLVHHQFFTKELKDGTFWKSFSQKRI